MVFPGLDGALGGIAAVDMWPNLLEGEVVLIEGFLHIKGAFFYLGHGVWRQIRCGVVVGGFWNTWC